MGWIIGGEDAKAKDFQCTRGVIFCKTAHGGKLPHTQVGNWLRLEGDVFREDAAISITSKPASLHVVSPQGQHRCAGEYRLLVGETVHSQAVWKQRRGIFRIFSSRGGVWQIVGNEKKESDYQNGTIALQCGCPHRGQMPDKLNSEWSRLEGDSYISDPSITLSVIVNPPAKLHMKSPNGQQRCAGEYVLVVGTTPNGFPLWRQMGGASWLYSGTNGMWIVGSKGAKDRNFDCSRGVIYSNTPHGGVMPDKLKTLWLRLDKEEFHEDGEIIVQGDHVPRKRKAAETNTVV